MARACVYVYGVTLFADIGVSVALNDWSRKQVSQLQMVRSKPFRISNSSTKSMKISNFSSLEAT